MSGCPVAICSAPLADLLYLAILFGRMYMGLPFELSSILGSGCVSRRTLMFNGFKSTHILTVLSFFGTTTMPAHHGVGVSTLDMIPRDSIQANSFCTF